MINRALLIHPQELDDTWLQLAKRIGLTELGLHPIGGIHADSSLAEMLSLLQENEYRLLLDKAMEYRIEVSYEMHALRYLLPHEMLRKNPLWKRMNWKGERVGDLNFCVSCPDAIAALTESAARLYAVLPDSPKRVTMWLDDGEDAFCHCPRCRKISPSDQQMIALHAILSGIRSIRNDATLSYLAYYETMRVPTRDDLKEGLFLQFAPYRRNLSKPLSDPECSENQQETETVPILMDFFGKQDATALDYWYDNSLYSHYTKPPQKLEVNPEIVLQDIRLYEAMGFKRISSFACYLGADYRALYGLPDLSAFSQERNDNSNIEN